MRRNALRAICLLTLSVLFSPAQSLFAAEPAVKDDAGMFSAKAITNANEQIAAVKEKYKKDVVIETFKAIPPDKRAEFESLDKKGKSAFFSKWVGDRAAELELNGIYVLITKDPQHLQIGVGKNTQQKAFTLTDRDELARRMLANFNEKKYDQGLLEGVSYIRTTIRGHTKFTENPDQGEAGAAFNWKGLICPALVIGAVIWIVFGIIRAFSGMGARGGYGAGGPGMGGGGFMTGLLGGLFGAMAGSWIYNSFLGGHSSDATGSSPSGEDHAGTGGDLGASDDGQGFDSTGGDFGSGGDAGGGDWGGGGGDWGGGD